MVFTGGLSKTTRNLSLTGCDFEPRILEILSNSSNPLIASVGVASVEEMLTNRIFTERHYANNIHGD